MHSLVDYSFHALQAADSNQYPQIPNTQRISWAFRRGKHSEFRRMYLRQTGIRIAWRGFQRQKTGYLINLQETKDLANYAVSKRGWRFSNYISAIHDSLSLLERDKHACTSRMSAKCI